VSYEVNNGQDQKQPEDRQQKEVKPRIKAGVVGEGLGLLFSHDKCSWRGRDSVTEESAVPSFPFSETVEDSARN
jgi:hypothetical protein